MNKALRVLTSDRRAGKSFACPAVFALHFEKQMSPSAAETIIFRLCLLQVESFDWMFDYGCGTLTSQPNTCGAQTP